jgi:Dyp-type peroxidase family
MVKLDLPDIQGIIARGYGNLRAACYVLLAIDDSAAAKAWLGALADAITTAEARPELTALNIAFTPTGLLKLGLGPDVLVLFSNEFSATMTTPHRSRILGDVGDSAPERWIWGGPTTTSVDLVLLLFARDDATLTNLYDPYASTLGTNGLRLLQKLETVDLGDKEHFGFHDGVSQPVIDGLGRTGPSRDVISAGEVILGYANEYRRFTDRPTIKQSADPHHILPANPEGTGDGDLGRNGTYLVFRQLRQDVRGFWRFLDQATKNPDNSSNPEARVRLAAKFVGRWPSGAPLVLAPDHDEPKLANANDFGYFHPDAQGLRCPIGSHVRRSNPRDSLDPNPGSPESVAVGKRHRLLRRGREYGNPVPLAELLSDSQSTVADDDRGLHFICLAANINRQFEFIQHTWINNPKFNGLYDDADPLLGVHGESGSIFVEQATPVRKRTTDLPQFVSVVGGAYFFLPGIRAIRYLEKVGR